MQGGTFHRQHWAGFGIAGKPISGQPWARPVIRRQNKRVATNALAPEHLEAVSASISHLLTLGYEAVVLPCSAQNCGDQVYRRYGLYSCFSLTHRSITPTFRAMETNVKII